MIKYILAIISISPSLALMAQSPVPVYEEPYHHLVYEDSEIRILDLQMAPGDTSAYHIHQDAITYIGLKGSSIWIDVPGLDSRNVFLPDSFWGGDTEYPEAPFVHRIANVGEHSFRLLAVEHLKPRLAATYPSEYLSQWESLDVNPYFLLLRHRLQPNEQMQNHFSGSGLLVARGEGQILISQSEHTASLSDGDWFYIQSSDGLLKCNNTSRYPIELILIHF